MKTPPIFELIAKAGSIPETGYVQHLQHGRGHDHRWCPAEQADEALRILNDAGADASVLGEIVESDRRIEIV